MKEDVFDEFIDKEIKAPYRDGKELKISRGVLEYVDDTFVKIKGKLGTIIINKKNIQKMSLEKK